MEVFINHTNHPSDKWSKTQLDEASKLGTIVDFRFPDIDPTWDSSQVKNAAAKSFDTIKRIKPNAVLCQGEAVYTFELVTLLKAAGIKVLAACTERNAKEHIKGNGITEKISEFRFTGFREY